jgi:hypothetical protein
MNKKLLIVITLTILFLTDAHATAKVGIGFDQGLGVTVQFDNVTAFLGNKGIAADYIFKRNIFDEAIPFNWTIGGGVFIGWHKGAGLRLPLGLNMAFNAKWDAYIQVHPALAFNHGTNSNTHLIIDSAIGVRYRF